MTQKPVKKKEKESTRKKRGKRTLFDLFCSTVKLRNSTKREFVFALLCHCFVPITNLCSLYYAIVSYQSRICVRSSQSLFRTKHEFVFTLPSHCFLPNANSCLTLLQAVSSCQSL